MAVAIRIAVLRDWRILDSGALSRAFAFSAQQLGVLPDDFDDYSKAYIPYKDENGLQMSLNLECIK